MTLAEYPHVASIEKRISGVVVLLLACAGQGVEGPAQQPVEVAYGKFDSNCATKVGRFFEDHAAGAKASEFKKFWETEHHAFGSPDNLIRYGWELEGGNSNILKYYRLRSFTDEQWDAMTLAEKLAAKSARNLDPKDFTSGWNGFERMGKAPKFLNDTIHSEGGGTMWETKAIKPIAKLSKYFEDLDWVHREVYGGGGYHHHVGFKVNKSFADELTNFISHGNDYLTIKMWSLEASAVRHPYLGPMTKGDVTNMLRSFRSGSTHGNKFNSLAPRSLGYPSIQTLEYRAIGYDLMEARKQMTNAVRFLESPKQAQVKFGDVGHGYRLNNAKIADIDFVSDETVLRFPKAVQSFLDDAIKAASEHNKVYQGKQGEELLKRWAYPLLKFEDRTYMNIPPDVKSAIIKARKQYVRALEEMAAEARSYGAVGAHEQEQIEWLIQRWATQSRLLEIF